MSQAIDRELQQYMALLTASQKESILAVIKTFLPSIEKPERISREQYNLEISEAEKRMDAGHYLTHEEVEKDAATW